MAPRFVVGDIDLSGFVKVAKEDGLDPSGGSAFDEPQFATSPASEGQALVQHTYGNREQPWPVKLNAATKDSLHQLVEDINVELDQDGCTIEWRDDGVTNSTFYDVEAGRFEPDYNYRRQVARHLDGVVRAWVRPFGHTATERIHATAIATNAAAFQFSLPTALDGDAPALLDLRIKSGSNIPPDGRIVAGAPLPHPSWRAVWTASQIRGPSGPMSAASGAHLGAAAAVDPNSRGWFLPLSPASIYQGRRLRLLGVGRSAYYSFNLVAPNGDVISRAQASVAFSTQDWGALDFGTFQLPDGPLSAATYRIVIDDTDPPWNNSLSQINTYPQMSALYLVPEDDLVISVDNPVRRVVNDRFSRWYYANPAGSPFLLTSTLDEEGYTYRTPPASLAAALGTYALTVLPSQSCAQTIHPGGSVALVKFGQQMSNVPSIAAWRLHGLFNNNVGAVALNTMPTAIWGLHVSSATQFLAQSGSAAAAVTGELVSTGSVLIARILYSQVGIGTTLLASQSIPSLGAISAEMELTVREGFQGLIVRGLNAATTYASVAAANPNFNFAGIPGAHIQATSAASNGGQGHRLQAWRAAAAPSNACAAGDVCRFHAPLEQRWCETAAGAWQKDLTGLSRGQHPQLKAPSSAAYAVFSMPVHQGPAADVLSVDVRVRERWKFER